MTRRTGLLLLLVVVIHAWTVDYRIRSLHSRQDRAWREMHSFGQIVEYAFELLRIDFYPVMQL